jgi:hypothetical protein
MTFDLITEKIKAAGFSYGYSQDAEGAFHVDVYREAEEYQAIAPDLTTAFLAIWGRIKAENPGKRSPKTYHCRGFRRLVPSIFSGNCALRSWLFVSLFTGWKEHRAVKLATCVRSLGTLREAITGGTMQRSFPRSSRTSFNASRMSESLLKTTAAS